MKLLKKLDWNKTVKSLEEKIDVLMRDQRVLNVVSNNINLLIRIQNITTKRLESVLKIADIPTLRGLNDLFVCVNDLEKGSMLQKQKIKLLEAQILELESKIQLQEKIEVAEVVKPRRKIRTKASTLTN